MTLVLQASELTVRYRGSGAPQVDSLTMAMEKGVTALVGRNGAGKSTFLKAIVGVERPESGELTVLGADLMRKRMPLEVLGRIGYLPQDFGYVGSITVQEFVRYGAWLKKVSGGRIPQAADEALDFVGMSKFRNSRMGKLSGGMRRRAGIAQAIVHNPDLLILDEPTSGLDPEQRVRFRELIRDLSTDRGVLMSSHLVEDVRALASVVVVLDEGRLLFNGTSAELSALGNTSGDGDSPLERGYIAALKTGAATR